MFSGFIIIFYNKNKSVSFSLLYFCLFGFKFEVWRKKTHLILFQVGFFFNIISFIFSYFLLFIWFLHFCRLKKYIFYCISLSLFHLFPFLFYSFCVFTFFCLCLFHALIFSIFILSIFIFKFF